MLNKVQIIGNLGRDPEIRSFQNGGRVANMSVATTEKWKDKSTGERKERTEWHRVSVINEALVDIIEKYLSKGDTVYIEGQLETRKYEKNGQEAYTTEIVLRPYNGSLKIIRTGRDSVDDDQGTERGSVASSNLTEDEIPF